MSTERATDTLFSAWFDAFEQCVTDGDWTRLVPLLDEDCQYLVIGVPFACHVRGKDAVIEGFSRSIASFDRRFDERLHVAARTRICAADYVRYESFTRYRKAALPPLIVSVDEQLVLRNGRVSMIVDYYDPTLRQTIEATGWLAQYAGALALDPSYLP